MRGDPDSFHLRVGDREQSLRCERSREGDGSVERGFGGSERDLLFQDDANECGKARAARPQRGVTGDVADMPDVRVLFGQRIDILVKPGDGQLRLRHRDRDPGVADESDIGEGFLEQGKHRSEFLVTSSGVGETREALVPSVFQDDVG